MTPVMVIALRAVSVSLARAESTPALYHQDPAHPWNRLHATLWIRDDADEDAHGADNLRTVLPGGAVQ